MIDKGLPHRRGRIEKHKEYGESDYYFGNLLKSIHGDCNYILSIIS